MKRHLMSVLQLGITVILTAFLSGCDKEKVTRSYTWYTPVYRTLPEVRAEMKTSPARPVKTPGKIYIYHNYIFLNEFDEGIHIFDNTNPSSPKNIAFIPIPGNQELAVRDNVLFTDSYSDLVSFDISDPKAVTAIKFTDNAFPYRNAFYSYTALNGTRPSIPDSIKVTVSWIRHDTTVSYNPSPNIYYDFIAMSGSSAQPGKSSTGQGGSMARFTLINDYLYTVSTSELYAFNIANPREPKYVNKTVINNQAIETIYPFKNKLFIGSNQGMFIYDVSTPGNLVKEGQFVHARSCDPVIADDTRAWVTLRTGTSCGGNVNQLEVVNIENMANPTLIKQYGMTNPYGLGKEGNILFVCDGKDGIKVYDAADANDLKLIKRIDGMEPYDVIASNNIALVVAKDGLYQFDYSNANNIRLLSKIGLE
ncbi:MAG: LVIVD repeat-containing protein [Niastella sp.]|uniref:LVIVD repeat-containing protein n=1 Tax=Niastella sp. TaxID=1869183 RepID=UPI00389AB11D